MPPELVFGTAQRDRITLRRTVELRLTLLFECGNCRHLAQMDALDLIGRHGPEATLGFIRRRARCYICKHRGAEILMRSELARRGAGWWPRGPLPR